MRKIIFLDTNIYLDFFRGNAPAIKNLIPPVVELSAHVFLTQQIVDEIDRNKLSVAQRALEEFRKRVNSDLVIPDFVEPALKRISRQKLGYVNESTRKKVEQSISVIMRQIVESADPVSTALAPLFKRAATPTPQVIEAARSRKEMGNPPGKVDGPLGDQLNWEQLLSFLQADDEVWMASRDSDYCVKGAGEVFLNPLLLRELLGRGLDAKNVHFFDNLTKGIKHFKDTSGVKVPRLPRLKVLQDAFLEELLSSLRSESKAKVESAVESLQPLERIVFVLHDLESYTLEEIAEMISEPGQTVQKALHSARLNVRARLSGK